MLTLENEWILQFRMRGLGQNASESLGPRVCETRFKGMKILEEICWWDLN